MDVSSDHELKNATDLASKRTAALETPAKESESKVKSSSSSSDAVSSTASNQGEDDSRKSKSSKSEAGVSSSYVLGCKSRCLEVGRSSGERGSSILRIW